MAIFIIRNWDDELNKSLTDAERLLFLCDQQRHQQQQQHHHEKRGIVEKSDDFVVSVDVQHFSPEDVSVKVVDGFLEVEARHEERPDNHGYIYRHFKRRYAIPEGYNVEGLGSKLSSDGVLTVRAPKLQNELRERVIPVVQTGPHRGIHGKVGKNAEIKNEI